MSFFTVLRLYVSNDILWAKMRLVRYAFSCTAKSTGIVFQKFIERNKSIKTSITFRDPHMKNLRRLPRRLPHTSRNPFRPLLHHSRVFAFHHHPQHRLGAGVAQQHASAIFERGVGFD